VNQEASLRNRAVKAMLEAHGGSALGVKNCSASQFAPAQAIEI
jgi:hypothetical protein